MRILRHSALAPSLRLRLFTVLMLAFGFVCGTFISSYAPSMYCGVLAPCADAGTHSDHDTDAATHCEVLSECGSCPDSGTDVCENESRTDEKCCTKDCPECFFCHSGPLVLLGASAASYFAPAVATLQQQDEQPLFLPSPPLHQPPRFLKYTQI
ncbi:MAG: hypothetical protein M5R41_02265 [Bacteroidia bacterium]|nr:hypothetical protein [Bacteroidia bacterium]